MTLHISENDVTNSFNVTYENIGKFEQRWYTQNLYNRNMSRKRAPASGTGGRGFDPGPGHTKDFQNCTGGYLLLGAQHYKASTGFSSPKTKYTITNIAHLI